MTTTTVFHPEMKETAPRGTQIIVERLYNRFKASCEAGLELKESRSIVFQYERLGRKVYYVTEAGLRQLEGKYRVAHSALLD